MAQTVYIFSFRDRRHYEGLQKYEEGENVTIKTIEDIKRSNDSVDSVPNVQT